MNLRRFWNGKAIGIPALFWLISISSFNTFMDKLSTYFWKSNLKTSGDNLSIQSGVTIRWPNNFEVGDNVSIGRNCKFSSDFEDSKFSIGDYSQINRGCVIDFSGDLIIGKNVVISENVNVMTHSHGFNPKSIPEKKALIIEDNVWIGSYVILLPQVERIGNGSIIASGSVLTKSVEPNSIFGGNPAKFIKYLR
jgi:acetyltransferase-like isoleucine patch superfamily enzyme